MQLAENMEGIPIVRTEPKQNDFCAYLKERKSELLENWDKKYILEPDRKPVEKLLEELGGKETYVVILYVDLEGSTQLSLKIDPETYAKL